MNSQRYQQPKVIEHLASQFVLGTLTSKVHSRVAKLAMQNVELEQAIQYWEDRLVTLDHQTDELPASESSWQAIAQQLDMPLL
jgi:anti-sigma-K factor RskA